MLRKVGSKRVRLGKTLSQGNGSTLNVRAVVITIVAAALSCGTTLLVVVYAYRKAYGIVGKPERALWVVARCLARVCSRTHT